METEIDHKTSCGFGRWYPQCLQKFANIWSFTIFNSIASLLTSTLSVYIGSQVPALEKQFGMSSYHTGLLMSFNDIGFLLCCLFVTTIARYVHIPRFLFVCFVLYGVSGVLCALPHFLTPQEEYAFHQKISTKTSMSSNASMSMANTPLCVITNSSVDDMNGPSCSGNESKNKHRAGTTSEGIRTMALTIIAIGMLIQGVGKAPRSPFITVYVDDNVDKRKTGYFIGIMSALAVFGAALAYGLGAVFSKLYVTLEEVEMSPRDPRWIGAWWLGFMVFGLGSAVCAIPIAFFPKRLRRSPDVYNDDKKREKLMTTKEKVKDRVLSFYRILKNPVYDSILVTNICQLLSMAGYLSFLSKYIKVQWTIPLWQSNIILGVCNLISISFGLFMGGLVSRKVNMTPQNAFKWLTGLFFGQVIFFVISSQLGCDQPSFVGPSRIHGEHTVQLNNSCSQLCGCDSEDFFPICGSDGLNYHSPCYAGCTESQKSGTLYSNCTCILDGKAEAGLCDSGCSTLWIWAASNFIGSFIGATKGLISFTVKIRCVDDKDKSTAIGLQSFLLSLLAFMPAPIIYGRIVDSTCILWQSCNSGACVLYDLVGFRLKLHLTSLAFQLFATFSTLFGLWWTWKWIGWYKKANDSDDQDNARHLVKHIQAQHDIVRTVKQTENDG